MVLVCVFCFVTAFSLGALLVYKIAVEPIKAIKTTEAAATFSPALVPSSKVIIPNFTKEPIIVSSNMQQESIKLSFSEGLVNILLVGVDYSPERESWKKNYYSDVMLVLAVDFDNDKVHMISVPRDTFAPIYNTPGIYKLNSSLHHGGGVEKDGFEYVIKSIENVLGGIDIDYYIGVNMTAVKDLVDAIGGIEYDVDIKVKMQGRRIYAGFQTLDGQQVLDYSRARKGIDNDIGRVARQKKVLIAVFDKLKQTNLIFEVPNIIEALKDNIYTNLSFEKFCTLAVFGKNLDNDNIKMYTVEGHFLQIFNWSFYILDDEERIKLIKEIYCFTPEAMPEASQKYAHLTWSMIKAEAYINIINTELRKDAGNKSGAKISQTSTMWLKKEMDVLQRAVESEDRYIIEQKSEALKLKAVRVFSSAGLSVSWSVNENIGKPEMTG